MPTFNSCSKRLDSWGIIQNRLPDCKSVSCIDDLTTERSFDSQSTRAIDVLGLFFDILFMGVCTTGHRQTSGRLVVQELTICTVLGFCQNVPPAHSEKVTLVHWLKSRLTQVWQKRAMVITWESKCIVF